MVDLETELNKLSLSKSFLIGFYGGGNMGDELLLEVLLNYLKSRKATNISFLYLDPAYYQICHKSFADYKMVNPRKLKEVFTATFAAKNIVIGGGGLWGLDFNRNALVLSIFLLISRFMLRKKIYLIGVGYYKSTSALGHIGAFLVARSANYIFARDHETYENFLHFTSKNKVFLAKDIAFLLASADLSAYEAEAKQIFPKQFLEKDGNLVLVTYRGNRTSSVEKYMLKLEQLILSRPKDRFILLALHPESKNQIYTDIKEFQKLQEKLSNPERVIIRNFGGNPVSFFCFLRAHHNNIFCVFPQYHGILLAALSGAPYLPISYDNKCTELLTQFGWKKQSIVHLSSLNEADLGGNNNVPF